MKRKSLLALAPMLCVLIGSLFVHASFAADSSTNMLQGQLPNDAFVPGNIETSAQCEARLKGAASSTQDTNKAGGMYNLDVKSCRSSCISSSAQEGIQWFGTAPACSGDEMKKNKKAYTDCQLAGGTPIDWSYCGDGKTCVTGSKIKCQMPTDKDYKKSTGTEGYIRYFGNPPFCNADNKKNECTKTYKGTIIGEDKCNGETGKAKKCCTNGKYLKCFVPAITGG